MSFPVTIGNRTFTYVDFAGRNYALGYPSLLEEFERSRLSGAKWLGIKLSRRIVPAFGRIVLTLPDDLELYPNQLLDLQSPKGWLVIQISSVTGRILEGRVVYLSEDFTFPQTEWLIGLGSVSTDLSASPLYLEGRDVLLEELRESSDQGLYNGGNNTNYGYIYPHSVFTKPLTKLTASDSNVIKLGAFNRVHYECSSDLLDGRDFLVRWDLTLQGEWEVSRPGVSLERRSNNIYFNSTLVEASPGGVGAKVSFQIEYDQNLDMTVITPNGTRLAPQSVLAPFFNFERNGITGNPGGIVSFHRSFYYV